MTPEQSAALGVWTPFLLGGFAMNLLIAALAMALGTGLGIALAAMAVSKRPALQRASLVATELARNIPMIVIQFYFMLMLPREFALPGLGTLVVPSWLIASIALTVPVTGFTAENYAEAWTHWRSGNHAAAMLFLPSWTAYLQVAVIASSTASIIGVSELVSRCNTVINANAAADLMLPVYGYACLLFFAACLPLTLLTRRIQAGLNRRASLRAVLTPPEGVARPAAEKAPRAAVAPFQN